MAATSGGFTLLQGCGLTGFTAIRACAGAHRGGIVILAPAQATRDQMCRFLDKTYRHAGGAAMDRELGYDG